MVKLNSMNDKFDVLHNAKKIKEWKERKCNSLGNKEIFINQDESPMTRKENYRLWIERNI